MSMITEQSFDLQENFDLSEQNFIIVNGDDSFDSDFEITPIKKLAKRKDEEIETFTLDMILSKDLEDNSKVLKADDDDNNSVCTEETGCNSRNMSSSSVSSFFVKKINNNTKSQFANNEKISNMLNENWENSLNDLKNNVVGKFNRNIEKSGKENKKITKNSILLKLQENVSLNTIITPSPIHFFKKF